MEGDVITMQEIFVFDKLGLTQDGKVIGPLRATGVRPKCASGCARRAFSSRLTCSTASWRCGRCPEFSSASSSSVSGRPDGVFFLIYALVAVGSTRRSKSVCGSEGPPRIAGLADGQLATPRC